MPPRDVRTGPARAAEETPAHGPFPLESREGGDLAAWLDAVRHGPPGRPLRANPALALVYGVCAREGTLERLVERLAGIEARLQEERARLERDLRFQGRMLADRDCQLAALQAEFVAMRRSCATRILGSARIRVGRALRWARAFAPARARRSSGPT